MNAKKTLIKDAYLRDTIERFTRHKMAVVGLVVLLLEIAVLFLLPVALGSKPNEITPYFSAPPSAQFPLGTDTTGRDLLARLLYGGQTSLGIGLLAVLVQALIGIPLGIIAGYYRGAAEVVIMRLADIFNSIPNMCLNLVLVTVFSPSFWTIVMVIGITGWPSFTRLLYSSVLSIREKEYVEAARAIGTKNSTIMARYILPNAISPALVAFTFGVPSAILSESALSFLGLGIQIPQSTWGKQWVAAAVIVMALPVYADDPLATINALSDFVFSAIKAIGAILLGFGIVQIGLALKSHDAGQRAQGFMTFFGGVVIYFAKDILDMNL